MVRSGYRGSDGRRRSRAANRSRLLGVPSNVTPREGDTHARLHPPRAPVRLRRPRAALLAPRCWSCTTTSTTRRTSTAPTPRSTSSTRPATSDDFGTINQLQKNLAFHLSGHVLHSMFWQNLSPDGGGKPEGDLGAAIDDGFGGFEGLKNQLTESALAVQGSGWGALDVGAARPAPHRRAGLRPPEQRRPGRAAAPRARHVGARVLPAVQEREGRLGQGVLGDRELARRRGALRAGPQAQAPRSPTMPALRRSRRSPAAGRRPRRRPAARSRRRRRALRR